MDGTAQHHEEAADRIDDVAVRRDVSGSEPGYRKRLAHTTTDPRVHTVPYRTHPVIAFVGRDHPWFRRREVALKDFAGQPFVSREPGSTTRRAFEAALAKAGIAIDPVFEIGSREGIWKAVEQGLGISVVADFEFVAHPNLRPVAIKGASIRTEYRLACLGERAASSKISAFLDLVSRMYLGASA